MAGYRRAFEDAGLDVDDRDIGLLDSPTASGHDEMSHSLDAPRPPTALVGLGTRIVSGALCAVRERGLRVPVDFSVIAIGLADLMEYAEPPLTTLRFDIQQSGEIAAQLLIERLNSTQVLPPRRVEVAMELVLGQSCVRAGSRRGRRVPRTQK